MFVIKYWKNATMEKNRYFKFKTLREAKAFIFGVQLVNDPHLATRPPIKTLGGYVVRVIEIVDTLPIKEENFYTI